LIIKVAGGDIFVRIIMVI